MADGVRDGHFLSGGLVAEDMDDLDGAMFLVIQAEAVCEGEGAVAEVADGGMNSVCLAAEERLLVGGFTLFHRGDPLSVIKPPFPR